MGQENRLYANRKQILLLLNKARGELARIDRHRAQAEEALAALKEAMVKVKAAKSLATSKPTPRSRRQPSAILKALDRADAELAKAELKVKGVPVTQLERLQKVAKKREKALAAGNK